MTEEQRLELHCTALGFWQGVRAAIATLESGAVPTYVPPRLRELEERARLSLAESAELAGVPLQTVGELVAVTEAGHARPPVFSHCTACTPGLQLRCATSQSCVRRRPWP